MAFWLGNKFIGVMFMDEESDDHTAIFHTIFPRELSARRYTLMSCLNAYIQLLFSRGHQKLVAECPEQYRILHTLLTRAGFVKEGHHRLECVNEDGSRSDMLHFGLLKEDLDGQKETT